MKTSTSESINLNLLENSHAFAKEAVSKAIAAQKDIRQWQFAILALVQSAELSLKSALNAIHPVLVFENVDSPARLVSIQVALGRLENPAIGKLTFTESDKKRIRRASELRNQITHAEYELTNEHAAANFFELFGFVSDFQRRHLGTDLSELISPLDFNSLQAIHRALEELTRRARIRIEEEGIEQAFVWECPNCGKDTFIIQNGIDVCYACGLVEDVTECPHCNDSFFESEMESFFDDIDSDYSEGQVHIHNSYGYSDFEACPECIPRIREKIQNEREDEEFQRLEEEYYLRSS